MMPEQDQSAPKHKRRSRIVTISAWGIAALLAPLCIAWILGEWSYWFDLIASQQILIGWIALILAVLVLITRRWAAGAICVVLAIVSLYPVIAGRILTLPSVDLGHKPDGVIRVVSCNINPVSNDWKNDLDLLFSLDADILILIESPWGVLKSIKKENMLDSTSFSSWTYRKWVDLEVSRCIILSRWPLETIQTVDDPEYAQHHLFAQVHRPLGEFVVGVMHPMSPRSRNRWVEGNRASESHARAITRVDNELGHPMLIGADLNAGPAQSRSRSLRSSRLKMSKPILSYGGSFPTNIPIPKILRVQIDDVWSLGDITPTAWSMTSVPGSDHMAIIAEFRQNQ